MPVAWGSHAAAARRDRARGARRERYGDLGELATTVALAILANAAVCGALSNPHDRYGARMVWLAALVLLLVPWRIAKHSFKRDMNVTPTQIRRQTAHLKIANQHVSGLACVTD